MGQDGSASIHSLYLDSEQGATVFTLDLKLDRLTAHLTVLDVSEVFRRQIDSCFKALTAIRALNRYEFLGQQASGRRGSGLVYGFEPVELIDAA